MSTLFVLTGRYRHDYQRVGDVNGDGFVDLVSLAGFTSSVWLGCGDGTFDTMPITGTIPTSNISYDGDFTGDGRMDLLYTTPYTLNPGVTATNLNLVSGQPDGTFAPGPSGLFGNPVGAERSAHLTQGVVGDINEDGRMDILFGGWYPNGVSSVGVVLYAALGTASNGLGVTSSEESSGIGRFGTVNSVELADIDGDGHLDALVAYTASTGTSSATGHRVVRGNGNGTFKDDFLLSTQTASTLPLGRHIWGRLDGDTKVDALLWAGTAGQIYWNDGTQTFALGPTTSSPTFGDFDGDGQADFLTSGSDSSGASFPGMIAFGDGARGFGRTLATPAIPLSPVDVNGDGVPDLVSGSSSGVLSIYVSTAKHPSLGPPDVNCAPLPADQCTGPTGF